MLADRWDVIDRVSQGVALPGRTIRAELDLPGGRLASSARLGTAHCCTLRRVGSSVISGARGPARKIEI
ncbi:hypothetical protein ACIGO6_00410 [Streptomyces sp. NPDC053750]|uniref:hypothetical protein n=1 Tax=Streptomyces sp. NPDC053750 TaxID=3365714 RepID=UPI0037D55185